MSKTNRVASLLTGQEQVLMIDSNGSVLEAAKKMKLFNIGCLLAADANDKVVGILTERDIVTKVVAISADPKHTPVAQIMTTKVISCQLETSFSKALELMAHNDIRHLPVIEDGVPLAMISSRDILAHQLSSVRGIVRRQNKILHQLENLHPGITQLETDSAGRVVI